MKKMVSAILAMMMVLLLCTAVLGAGSPVWGKTSPVVDVIDFDSYTATWSKAGAYSANYSYDAEAVKTTGDKSKFLQLTKTTGASGQRGDARITFSAGQTAVAGSMDFSVVPGSKNDNYLAKIWLNLTDGTTQKETLLAGVKADNLSVGTKNVTVTEDQWYRLYYDLNRATNQATVVVYSLNEKGHIDQTIVETQTISLTAGLENTDWYVNRYTLEMYSTEGSGIGVDNFVLYDKKVQFVSFEVEEGGTVSLGENKEISAGKTGFDSEVAVGTEEELSFAVQPEDGYELEYVTVDETDQTALFASGRTASLGTLSANAEIQVGFVKEGTVKPSAVGSPAWGKVSPVVDVIDFDSYTATWSKAGAYSANYSYDAEAVKTTGDKSKFLQLTKTTGAKGQRGDARITFSAGQTAAAGSMDFFVVPGSKNEDYLAKIMLNLTDGTTQKETLLAGVKADNLSVGTKNVTVTEDQWYRLYYDLNRATNQATVVVYSLNEKGHIDQTIVETQTISLATGLENTDWYVNRYTLEMYSPEGSGIGFDNFVLYDKKVQFVSFEVEEGGTVSLGENKEISAGKTGFNSELLIEQGKELAFSIQTEQDFKLSQVLVGADDHTSAFQNTADLISVGLVSEPTKVKVDFQNDLPSAPVISDGSIVGEALLNQEVSVAYRFGDPNGDGEDTAKREVIWERSENGQDGWTQIAEGNTYTLKQEDVQKYLRAVIVAYADSEPYESNRLTTSVFGPISGNIYAISSPAWRKNPVIKTLDFDTDSAGWSKAGAYSNTMNYNDKAVREDIGGHYLEITRESGAAGQRADLRIRANESETKALEFDVKIRGISGDTQGVGIVQLNLSDGVNLKENRMVVIKNAAFGDQPIQNNTWYRVRIQMNPSENTYGYQLLALGQDGTIQKLLYNRENVALSVDGLGEAWYLNGLTVEMYGTLDSMIAFDNFVFYNQPVNTASFLVGAGGSVEIGDYQITAASKGIASEAAVAKDQELIFKVQPDEGYVVHSVKADGQDITEQFKDGQAGSAGLLTTDSKIEIAFYNTRAETPKISDAVLSGLGIVGSDLTVSYTFEDSNFDSEDPSGRKVRWQRSVDGNEPWTDIQGADNPVYTITEEDNNQYLRAVVQAKATAEPFYSNELVTPAFRIGQHSFWVAPDGDDSNDGTMEKPFASITAARDAIRAGRADGSLSTGNIVVNIRGGYYPLTESIMFDGRDSGQEGNPVVYQAYNNEKVVFEGGKELEPSQAVKVTDQAILNRVLDDVAREKLMMIDLGAAGIELPPMIDYGHALNTSWRPHEIYINGAPLEKSVWPNPNSELGKYIRTTTVELLGTDNTVGPFSVGFEDPGDRTKLWSEESLKTAMIGGFLSNDYSCQHMQIASLDPEKNVLITKGGCHYAPANSRRVFFWNLLEEIDQPGESFIDRENDIVYFYPPADMKNAEIVVSAMEQKMLVLNGCTDLTFRNLNFEYTRETIADVTGSRITFDGCVLAHTSGTGIIATGNNLTIQNSHIYDCGYGGINISGGDRVNLISSENLIHNNRIHDVARVKETYSPAINVAGMGVTMTHNALYHNMSQIIGMTGNDHLIAYNDIYEAVLDSADQGAIYWGRNPTELGIRLMYNYFHDMENDYGGYGHQAVFWDDGAYGPYVYGNVFFRSSNTKDTGSVSLNNALKTNGGNFSYVKNNIFIDGANAFNPHKWNTGSKAYGWWLYMYDKFDLRQNPIYEKVTAVPASGEAWTNYYRNFEWQDENGKVFSTDLWSHLSPAVSTEYADAMKDLDRDKDNEALYQYAIENGSDFYNVFEDNICVDINVSVLNNTGQATETRTYQTKDHGIFKEYGSDFALTEEGLQKVRKTIPGFENVPFDKMGLVSQVGGTAPEAIAPEILGESNQGNRVAANYVFRDADGDLEGISQIEWYLSDSENGTYEKLGYSDFELEIKEAYQNKFIKYEITPIDRQGLEGTPVWSQPICVGKTVSVSVALKELIEEVKELSEAAEVGSSFGNVSEDAAKKLENALLQAEKADMDDAGQVLEQITALQGALEEWKKEVITVLPNPIPSDSHFKTEPFMGDLHFDAGKAEGVSISVPTGEPLQQITASGVILVDENEVPVTLTIPAGTIVTAAGKDRVTLNLFGDDSTPSRTVALAQEGKLTAIHASDDTLQFSQPISYLLTGVPKNKIFGAISDKYYSINNKIASAENLSGNYGRIEANEMLGIAAKELKELVIYTFKAGTPSPTVSPTHYPVVIPNQSVGGGVTGVGLGSIGDSNDENDKPAKSKFTDIIGHWAENDIVEMADKGIVSGVTSTAFDPDRSITRAEFAAMMTRALKLTAANADAVFNDVSSDKWYAKDVASAAAAGLIVGYDGAFRPDDTITREEMAVVIMKAYAFLGKSPLTGQIDKFGDKDEISEWAYEYVDQAVSSGLISGITSDTFAPSENATRAQVTSLIKRLLDSYIYLLFKTHPKS